MREILFRGKHSNEWVYGWLFQMKYDTKKYLIRTFPDKDDNYEDYVVEPETIGQYTGLVDKNGTKIFEGDICVGNGHIEKDDEKFIIKYGKYKTEEWQEKYSCNTYQFGWYAEFIKSKSQVHLVIPNGIKVIGNIYDKEVCNE